MSADAATHSTGCRPGLIACLLCTFLCITGCERPAPSSDDRTRLELWTLALRPRFDAYMSDLVARFEREHPNIDVVWVDVPFDAVQRKFLAAAAAGRAPDVVNLSDGFYSRLVALGGLADLSDLVPGDPDQTYFPGALTLCRIDGKLYGLPWYLATNVLFANEALLAEGGLGVEDIADDWPGLMRQAAEYHRKTGKFLISPLLGHETRLPSWMLEDCLFPLRPRRDGSGGLESNLDDPAIISMVRQWVELYRSGALPAEAAVGGHGAMIDLYQNGRTALLQTGPNFLERIRDQSPEVFARTHIIPSPRWSGGKYAIATMLFSVSSQSKHPRAAAELAWFLTNAPNQLEFARIVSILPSTPASMSDPHFQNRASKIDAARALSAECLDDAMSFIAPIPAWPDLIKAFEERIKSALIDGADVERTLEQIGRDWNGILASHPPADAGALPDVRRATDAR